MKFRTLLVNGLIVAATLFLFGCADLNTETASAFGNQGWWDTTYTFDKAIIDTFDINMFDASIAPSAAPAPTTITFFFIFIHPF